MEDFYCLTTVGNENRFLILIWIVYT